MKLSGLIAQVLRSPDYESRKWNQGLIICLHARLAYLVKYCNSVLGTVVKESETRLIFYVIFT